MSLVLIVVHDRQAIVVSDGAETEYLADGATRRARNDCPKFREIGDYIVAITGTAWMFDRVMRAAAERIRSGPSFNELAAYLSSSLPGWAHEDAARVEREGGAVGFKPGAEVALVSIDPALGRARAVAFEPSRGFAPVEVMGYVAMGVANPIAAALMAEAWRKGAPWEQLSRTMRKIVGQVSREHEQVGGNVYVCEMRPGNTAVCFFPPRDGIAVLSTTMKR